ncbi:MAG: hypothetical protein NC311_09085 [Muribaculaceae bacterium]|nr:hypothetical protein [Muribaculaceae bacterium]
MANKDFLYGIGKFTFKGSELGYIEKGSFDFGGKEPESVDIEAEQVPDAPVLSLAQKNGTIEPTFNLIQLDYANLQAVLGGEGSGTGWSAPTALTEVSGECVIDLVSGQRITIPNGKMIAYLSGKLTLTEVAKIACKIKVQKPAGGKAPYTITDIAGE